jgi:hypothetical protein
LPYFVTLALLSGSTSQPHTPHNLLRGLLLTLNSLEELCSLLPHFLSSPEKLLIEGV